MNIEEPQQYVLKLRECWCSMNTLIVLAVARGIAKVMERTRLSEHGGQQH